MTQETTEQIAALLEQPKAVSVAGKPHNTHRLMPAAWPVSKAAALIGAAAFIIQRLLFGTLVLLAIIFLSYFGLDMARGAPLRSALARATTATPAYLGRLAEGHLGLTAAGSITLRPIPVAEVVPAMLTRSLGLLAAALLIAALVGVALGVWAAGRRRSSWSVAILLISILGVSVPSFLAALLLQFVMIRWTRIFGHPLLPVGGFGWDKHVILPALVLAARPIAQIFRVTFLSVGEVLDQDFVRTAHSRGLSPRRVMGGHVIRNAAIPILTTVGLSLRFSLSSLPVVEFFFGWPGVGFNLLKGIARQDDNLTVILVLCLGALFILVNFVLEASYRLINPRLRQSSANGERREPGNSLETLKSILAEVADSILDSPLRKWLNRQPETTRPSPFRAVLEQRRKGFDLAPQDYAAERRRAWLRGTLANLPFMVGAILVAGLVIVFVFGPRLAPHSPYTTHGLVFEDGKFIVPPFAPDETYPWGTDALGRDVMSLILAGAQQTLLLALLVVTARMVLGFVLGAVTGWLNGSWVDRLLLGAAETIAAFPTLLLAMILVLALGIRQGLRPFVIALCFMGWGEIMQYVRAEVLTIRPKPFIESAVALGLRTPRIIVSHVLPNLVPALISIAALEMGAVLMLLGELGFLGIFIGGGAFAELAIDMPRYHYSDVPEWGALLSNVRTYAVGYPWMGLYPALAFFAAILGFNLFGEGVRRMVEGVGVGMTRLINRYTVVLAVMTILGIGWVRQNSGAVVFYRRQADAFDGQQALARVQFLADPALNGRALGTPGMEAAADYIAQQFQALGLQAAGKEYSYFQTRSRAYESLDTVPQMTIEDDGPSLVYGRDYTEYPSYYRNLGQIRGPVRFLAMGDLTRQRTWTGQPYPALKDLNLSDAVVMVLSEQAASYLQETPRGGVMVVAEDPADVLRRYTLSPRGPAVGFAGVSQRKGHDIPAMRISQATAARLLKGTGYTLADLRRMAGELGQDELLQLPTEVTVSIDVQGTVHEKAPARHVVGHLPGTSAQLDDRLIVVLAQYDSPPSGPDGIYPSANDNASGVAVMLEAIHTMQETGYQPYKTFLFVAYSGEGLEGGKEVNRPEAADFLKAKYGFSNAFEVEAVIRLRGLGAGQGDSLVLSAGGSQRLANLFGTAARQMDVRTSRAREPLDISTVFEEKSSRESAQEAPEISLSWQGWEETSRTPMDTLETVSADRLGKAGRTLALALMILGRETQY